LWNREAQSRNLNKSLDWKREACVISTVVMLDGKLCCSDKNYKCWFVNNCWWLNIIYRIVRLPAEQLFSYCYASRRFNFFKQKWVRNSHNAICVGLNCTWRRKISMQPLKFELHGAAQNSCIWLWLKMNRLSRAHAYVQMKLIVQLASAFSATKISFSD
jgi:hypothetical protein